MPESIQDIQSSGTPPEGGRAPRSRLDRPCDVCRRHKHLCLIPVRGEPCVSCKARKRDCTFSLPPTSRKRKPKLSPEEDGNKPLILDTTGSIPGLVNVGHGMNANGMGVGVIQNHMPMSSDLSMRQWAGPSGTSNTRAEQVQVQATPLSASTSVSTSAFWRNTSNDHSRSPVAALLGLGGGNGNGNGVAPNLLSVDSIRPLNITVENNDPSLSPRATLTYSPDGVADAPIAHPPSLDLDGGDEEESHFLGSGAFSGLTLREVNAQLGPTSNATLSFRQVSSNPRFPAYFVKQKSFMYGRSLSTGQSAFEAICRECRVVAQDIPSKALSKLLRITLPALPFINGKRLETACLGLPDSGPVPYALLAGIIAHTTSYISEIRPMHKTLWANALLAIEDEFRQPRLRTLQMSLLLLVSRPSENAGQAQIGLSRAVGAAHLLGLHIDPTDWALPRWERSVRKRIWWTLLIHDKWRSLLYGRPSDLHKSNHNVSLPTIEDGDWGKYVAPADRLSLETFIATCRLTLIVDRLLGGFYTVDATISPSGPITRIALLESIKVDLNDYERSLSGALQWTGAAAGVLATLPTGVRSMQLSFFGLEVIVGRLLLETISETAPWQTLAVAQASLKHCQTLVEFVNALSASDRDLFWMPYSSHHISNSASLLLRIALRTRSLDSNLASTAVYYTTRLTDSLIGMYQANQWDVAESALRRIATLLLTAGQDLPDVRSAYRGVAGVLGIPVVAGYMMNAEDLLASTGLNEIDPMMWMGNDMSWFDAEVMSGFGAAGAGMNLPGVEGANF